MSSKKIKKVSITPGCISCGSCEAVCPDIFEVPTIAHVKEGSEQDFDQYAEPIREAADMCPVGVIQLDEHDDAHSEEST